MAETLPENIEPYPGISSKAYEHPADRAATAALKAVPMLDTVVRKLIEWGYERALRQSFLGNPYGWARTNCPTCGPRRPAYARSSTCRRSMTYT